MSRNKTVKLGEICDIKAGGTPARLNSEFWNNGNIPWVKIGDIKGKYVNATSEAITELGLKNSSTKLFEKGTIIYTIFATLGEVAILNIAACTNQAIAGLTIKDETVNINFLYWFLVSIKPTIIETGRGVAQNNINLAILKNIEIPLPPLDEQKRIAEEIDKITTLIEKRKNQIEKLDLLVKSKFVEMFGDPVTNPMGWEVNPVIEYCDCMVPGRDKPKSFTGKTPWITIDDLIVNGFTNKSKQNLGLSEKEISEVKRKTVPTGSVIMSCVGNLGICSIANIPLVINQQLHSFQCKDKIVNIYLMYYLGYRKDYMNSQASSTTVAYMNKAICNSIPVMLPPLPLQTGFANYVKKVESIKANVQSSLEKLETLKKSRMQYYFE